MTTSVDPVATAVHPPSLDPTYAAGRPLMNTEEEPTMIGAICVPHFLPPGLRCDVDTSATRAAPRPLIFTSVLAVAMTYALQWGTPASPCLAAAGTLYLHQSIELWHPSIDLSMLFLSMRAWRDFGTEFYHTIKFCGYVFIPVKRV